MGIGKGDVVKATAKKVKVVGVQSFVNKETGEISDFHVIDIKEQDANFSKIWLAHVLEAVEQIGNAKMRVMMKLIEKRQPQTNTVIATVDEIAGWAEASEKTVRETIKALSDAQVLTRLRSGVLMLNPEVIFKGGHGQRMDVLIRYRQWTQQTLPGIEEAREKEPAPAKAKVTPIRKAKPVAKKAAPTPKRPPRRRAA